MQSHKNDSLRVFDLLSRFLQQKEDVGKNVHSKKIQEIQIHPKQIKKSKFPFLIFWQEGVWRQGWERRRVNKMCSEVSKSSWFVDLLLVDLYFLILFLSGPLFLHLLFAAKKEKANQRLSRCHFYVIALSLNLNLSSCKTLFWSWLLYPQNYFSQLSNGLSEQFLRTLSLPPPCNVTLWRNELAQI